MLTIHEAMLRDQELDIDGRERLYREARELIHEEFGLPARHGWPKPGGPHPRRPEVRGCSRNWTRRSWSWPRDHYASEYAARRAKTWPHRRESGICPRSACASGTSAKSSRRSARQRSRSCSHGLGTLWRQNPSEKVVIFATYLGTVDLHRREIEETYPGQGVVVLRGGDHGAKLAAERRFKQKDGPRVLVCTAAGREGINLQFARILFNFDLPWNPMDMEQRIGRIHRYGQKHTAQVYNLVSRTPSRDASSCCSTRS